MSYSICLIDDALPASQISEIDDTKRLNSSNLKALLAKRDIWSDENIKTLTDTLLKDDSTWNVSAFTNPNIYFNCRREEFYAPEIVILDWEYPAKDEPTATHLQTMLETSFAIVYIFTGADQKHNVDDLITKPPFNLYKERIRVIHKEDGDSVQKMLREVITIYESSFSFRFGKELRTKALESVDRILVGLGNVASKDAKIYFGDKKDLIDFISERFKNYMATTQFEHLSNKDLTAKKYDEAIIRQLWFYRLFYFKDQKDTLIRRGDIIQEGDNNKVLYMVISGDCDLKRFWHKNFGHLSVLPLHLMAEGNTELIEKRLCLTRAKSKLKNELCQSSLTGKMGNISEAAFILPFLKIDNVFRSFLGLPASLTSIYIPKPTGLAEGKLKSEPLKYGHLDGYKYMFTISEPFLTPLIQKVLNDISGLGVPDFNTAEEIVKTDSNKILK